MSFTLPDTSIAWKFPQCRIFCIGEGRQSTAGRPIIDPLGSWCVVCHGHIKRHQLSHSWTLTQVRMMFHNPVQIHGRLAVLALLAPYRSTRPCTGWYHPPDGTTHHGPTFHRSVLRSGSPGSSWTRAPPRDSWHAAPVRGHARQCWVVSMFFWGSTPEN